MNWIPNFSVGYRPNMPYRLRTLPPGQFGLSALFVVMTLAAIAFAIIRLHIQSSWKMYLLLALWICFRGWASWNPNPREAASLAYLRRLAVLNAVGSITMVVPFVWLYLQIGTSAVSFTTGALGALLLLFPARAIWLAVKAMRAEFRQTTA
jgi:hypothetical protein